MRTDWIGEPRSDRTDQRRLKRQLTIHLVRGGGIPVGSSKSIQGNYCWMLDSIFTLFPPQYRRNEHQLAIGIPGARSGIRAHFLEVDANETNNRMARASTLDLAGYLKVVEIIIKIGVDQFLQSSFVRSKRHEAKCDARKMVRTPDLLTGTATQVQVGEFSPRYPMQSVAEVPAGRRGAPVLIVR